MFSLYDQKDKNNRLAANSQPTEEPSLKVMRHAFEANQRNWQLKCYYCMNHCFNTQDLSSTDRAATAVCDCDAAVPATLLMM